MKLVVFDMDGVLLRGRTILFLAESFGFRHRAVEILGREAPKREITMGLAGLLKGIEVEGFMDVVKGIPLTEGAAETLEALKRDGHRTAIITDSYDLVAEHFRERLGMDRAVGNRLMVEDGRITGGVEMPLNCPSPAGCNSPSICKMEVMKGLAEELGVPLSETIAIGDNAVDICMVKGADLGIAFNPKVPELEEAADVVIRSGDLREILRYTSVK
ncbi:MAG: HAD family hydrolase [Methanobacteriota archaeon]|nr:MAG: HAD family hydrolase [Euryarchaeota archaeon]